MADAAAPLDASTRAALEKLADIAVPPPVSWMPQTWGWAILGILALTLVAWLALRDIRRRRANRYRREALRELDRLTPPLDDEGTRGEALVDIAALLKRVALAAWPRAEVASLSGAAWVTFLRTHAGATAFPDSAGGFLDDLEYRRPRTALSAADGRRFAAAAHSWIERHDVSA